MLLNGYTNNYHHQCIAINPIKISFYTLTYIVTRVELIRLIFIVHQSVIFFLNDAKLNTIQVNFSPSFSHSHDVGWPLASAKRYKYICALYMFVSVRKCI